MQKKINKETYMYQLKRDFSITPIYLLAFFRAISMNLVGLALPNYIIFDYSSSTLPDFFLAGLSNTVYCIPYSIFPLFSGRISDKFGRKNTLILSIFLVNVIYLVYLLPFEPILFFSARFCEGFATSFFWPVIQSIISDRREWDDDTSIMSRFNVSWNGSGIVAFLIGAVAVYFINNNYISFIIAEFFCLSLIPTIILLKIPNKERINNILNLKSKEKITHSNNSENDYSFLNSFPLLIPIILMLIHSTTNGVITILVSKKFELFYIGSYVTYIISFSRTFAMTTFAGPVGKIKNRKFGMFIFLAGIIHSSLMLIPIFTINPIIITLLYFVNGFTSISIYTSGFKVMLAKNFKEKTGKYTGIFEAIIGIGYGISPIIVSFIAEISLNLGFGVFAILSYILTFGAYITYFINKKKNKI